MGISDLWPILSSLSNDRIPFPVFLSQFIAQHGRPPRLAIDAYMFMFWSQLPNSDVQDPQMERRIIRNFMAKLWYLVQCNISFVVVFDGKFKPGKLRNGHIPDLPDACSYDDSLHYFKKLHHSCYSEGSRLVDQVTKLMSRNCMDWVQAPGEAEAECAWLQRLGIVDYVVSDDSDTLVFGASGVLRMFNRVKYYNEDNEPVLSSTDYYVTPIYMEQITERTSLTRDHLVLIAVLRGGDYSSGAQDIGITRAKEIALCGTTVLSHSPRKKVQDFGTFPDITQKFVDIFVEREKVAELSPDPFHGLKPALDRDEGLQAFNAFLNDFLIDHGDKVFGRTTNFKNKIKIDEFYALLYYFPFVNRRLFKFMPTSITFGELQAVDADLSTNCGWFKIPRVNSILSSFTIGHSICERSSQRFVPNQDFKMPQVAMPRERKVNLKPLALKLLRDPTFWEAIALHRVKEFEGIKLGVLRFNRVKLNEQVYLKVKDISDQQDPAKEIGGQPLPKSPKDADSESAFLEPEQEALEFVAAEENPSRDENTEEDKLFTFHVPLKCIEYISREYVSRYEQALLKRKSPQKKKAPPQKTTLDSLWPSLSPKKESFLAHASYETKPMTLNTKSINPFEKQDDIVVLEKKEVKSPKKSPRRRKQSRHEVPAGQSTLTSYFEKKEKINRFHDSLFVISDEEPSPTKNSINNPCLLRYKVPRALSPSSSVESSPTKQTRVNMSLSPDTSPVKAKTRSMRDY